MTRSSRTRRVLLPLATLVAATGIALASGATFSTSTASTGVVASGTLRQLNSSTVAFDRANLKPGDTVTGSVTITNNGTLPGRFTLTETAGENTFVPQDDVTVEIRQTGVTTPVSATKGIGTAGAIDLGTFAAGEARTYTWTVTLKASAANSQQGKSAAATYAFTSVQADGEPLNGQQATAVPQQSN